MAVPRTLDVSYVDYAIWGIQLLLMVMIGGPMLLFMSPFWFVGWAATKLGCAAPSEDEGDPYER